MKNEKMKILILAANPINTHKLRLDEEVREIYAALERAKLREEFEIIPQLAVRSNDLLQALVKHKPQIIHFSGHGAGNDGLVLENDSGQAQLVSTQVLTDLFKLFKNKIQCVLLNACYSEAQAEAIHQHIDYVIGMNQAIGDRAAIKFAEAFYQGLGNELSIEDACELGRIAIQLAGIPEVLTPMLKSRPKSAVESAISSQQEQSEERTPFSNLFNISNSDIKNVSGSGIINYHESSL
ncbi:CHAT domain-containing protein [Iningainema sp. BLCCT55]|uniref:CHAT domain-containing protein n=2 Tax=Iningainema TaxID=1932705 RepID=A0A8J6XDM0_9CYAN|nr:CHAT domain-containing protein [Iningainema tapete]MBD2774140.1 CHAT domain-containing protein [Iningainema tapete BLCC-T55]